MSAAPRLARLATFREVADALGYVGANRVKRTRTFLLGHARRAEFLVRANREGASGQRVHYRVNVANLKRVVPELRDADGETLDRTKAAVREYVEQIRGEIREVRTELEALEGAVGDRYRDLVERVRRLEAGHIGAGRMGGR